MAWLQKRGTKYRLCFRFGGRMYREALGTADEREAEACRARLEDALNRVERGWLKLPDGVDLTVFLLSGGEVATRQEAPLPSAPPLTVGGLKDAYLKAQEAALETPSLKTLGIHLNHLMRTLGADTPINSVTLADLQRHVDRRRGQRGVRGKPITGYTIRKEMNSFAASWKWARLSGMVKVEFPGEGLKYPKSTEKPPFQTRSEIERQIARGGLKPSEVDEIWDGLFLTLPETAEVLEYIRGAARPSFLYPMAAFAAHTGARRSEIIRARWADIDLDSGTAVIREKKRVKGVRTTRRVPLSPFLVSVLKEWQAAYPGGPHVFCQAGRVRHSRTRRPSPTPITRDEAHDHLKRTLDGGPWSMIRGWHVFRHSFVSKSAAKGVDQRLIDAWVGHTTESMRRRYRHLLPDSSSAAIRAVFGGE